MAAGKVRLEMERTSLPTVVEGALDGLRGAARAKRIELRLDLEPVEVFADAGRLQQVIWNLISNAIKFTPAGGSVTVATARDGDGRSVLRVRDTGEGIDADLLPHVFERFQQADMSVTRRYGGLGLGLSIARHLVEMHGGTIRAESGGRGKGAELTVVLPVPPPDACTTEHACPPPRHALAGVAVLVVDDDSDGRDLARQILEGQGASVAVAASATEALDALRVCRPGILVSDVGMPDLDGYELVRRLRAAREAGLAALPAVALTAYARPEDRARALAVGFHEHVPKPFDPATLVSAIKSAYRGSAATARAS